MLVLMPKETRLNLRISEAFREDIERLAAYHGLSMSSFAHSLLVKAVRREKDETPDAFDAEPHKAPVVARISGGQTKAEIEHDFKSGVHLATSSKQDIPFGKTHTKAKRKTR